MMPNQKYKYLHPSPFDWDRFYCIPPPGGINLAMKQFKLPKTLSRLNEFHISSFQTILVITLKSEGVVENRESHELLALSLKWKKSL